ncbi:MAG: hypothetical protein R3C19_21935 [Planctomycetaceae bacterium]
MTSLLAIIRFEWNRTMTSGRIAWWVTLAAFPVVITSLVRWFTYEAVMRVPPDRMEEFLAAQQTAWSIVLYMLVPCVASAVGVLLSAAPAIAGELEQRSWVYMATRPNGIFWLMLGKYMVAVVWGASASIAGLTVAVPITGLDVATAFDLWFTLVRLCLLSCGSYAAVFMLIGAIIPHRAMVFCVAYTGVVEVVISMIPAVINRITVQYRLRSLFVSWTGAEEQLRNMPFFEYVFNEDGTMLQILWLLALTAVFLVTALVIAHRREFTAVAESDV